MNVNNINDDQANVEISYINEEYTKNDLCDFKLGNRLTDEKGVPVIHELLMAEEHLENSLVKTERVEVSVSSSSLKLEKYMKMEADILNPLSEDRTVDEHYGLLIHDEIVLFSCRHCRLAYDNYVQLKDHSVVEHGALLQRKDCQHCLQVFETHTLLLHHLKQQHLSLLPLEQAEKLKKKFPHENGTKRFLCDMCKKSFSSKASLLNHLKKLHMPQGRALPSLKKTPSDVHECTECSIVFPSAKELHHHHETTHSSKTYLCLDCDSTFQTRSSLNLHNIYHHRVHRCSSCHIFFQGRLALTNHVKTLHPGMPVYRADSRFVCEYCSQTFSVRSQLSDHIQSSHLGRINQCEDCGKVLSTAETLKVHQLKHRPEKHRTCEHCGRQFYRTGMLTEHIRACHSEVLSDDWRQRTTCPYCQARFTRRESMRRHIEAKHEPKRFLCSFCQRPFTCRRYLVRHENKHHLGRPSS